jgi:hypothetical protein
VKRRLSRYLLAGLLLPALAAAEPELPPGTSEASYAGLGPQLAAGLGAGASGDDLVAELGVRLYAFRALERRWLRISDVSFGARGGVLANAHPYLGFVGGRGSGDFELGYRFAPEADVSAFVSGRVAANLQVMGHPGLAMSALDTINSSDGFGGVTLDGFARLSGGASWLVGGRSLLLAAFAQEALRAPRVVAPGMAFTEFGLSARTDLSRSFVAELEAFAGFTAHSGNNALLISEQSYHLEASGWLKKLFENGWWVGLNVSWGRDSHHQVYTQTKTAFDTTDAPAFAATLNVGKAIWRKP